MDNKFVACSEAEYCINKGFIDVNDDVQFKTIRDVSDLFNKQYSGFQRSWIKVYDDWKIVASCYQMPENNLYTNMLSVDGNRFCYSLKEDNDVKKEETVKGIIEHEMETTYLFLKYPNSKGYKFVGIFEKDIDAMKESIATKKYMVIYKKKEDGNRLYLNQFFNK